MACLVLGVKQKDTAREIIGVDPNFSLAKYANTQLYRDSAILNRLIDGLRDAGLPE